MDIHYLKEFKKHYQKRIAPHKNLEIQFRQRLALCIENPKHQLLRNHRLIGEKSQYNAFSVTGDIRVVYRISDGILFLYDVGSHNQVYEK